MNIKLRKKAAKKLAKNLNRGRKYADKLLKAIDNQYMTEQEVIVMVDEMMD